MIQKLERHEVGLFRPKVHIVKYADDFIITASTKQLLEEEVLPIVKEFMQTRGLELSEEKTTITNIYTGFDFLGRNLRKYNNGKLLIKPSKSNIRTFLTNIKNIIKKNIMMKQNSKETIKIFGYVNDDRIKYIVLETNNAEKSNKKYELDESRMFIFYWFDEANGYMQWSKLKGIDKNGYAVCEYDL